MIAFNMQVTNLGFRRAKDTLTLTLPFCLWFMPCVQFPLKKNLLLIGIWEIFVVDARHV